MGPLRFSGRDRTRAIGFAVLGTVLPVAIAVATDFSSHRTVFFAGAAGASIAALVATMVPRRRRLIFWPAAFGGIPALTLLQAYTGGPASGYSVLMMMAMVWFGLQANDRELLVGMGVLAACSYLPMLIVGPPAYPVSWGHATLLMMIGGAVAGSLRILARETQLLARRLHEEAVVDELTGLLNRRGWRNAAPRELNRSARTGSPIALVMLDLDNFKQLNDQLGHEAGDRLLRVAGARVRATLRAGDVVARYGGDELVALLTDTTLAGALGAIARLREAMPPQAAFSAGVALWDHREDLRELLRRADLALYAAKARGGGETEVARAPLESVPSPEPTSLGAASN